MNAADSACSSAILQSPTPHLDETRFAMSTPATTANSRRRPARPASPSAAPSLVNSFQNMSIRKGDTFHPKSQSGNDNNFWDPLETTAASQRGPPRGTTCPKSLEDLLLGAGERRAAELMARVDEAVEKNSPSALGKVLSDPEVLPRPDISSGNADDEPERAPRKVRTNSHGSDSGIGSSVISEEVVPANASTDTSGPPDSPLSGTSTITEQRGLSKYASEQICKHIIGPILREQSLKDFHPLVKDVPSRIGNKEIKTLRDLEKTLIFLAPDHSRTPYKYLHFCEATIRVLHTTATTLHESDQRAPTDRPYTQGYFFDLIEQIRRYATILAATREKKSRGEELDEMDYASDEGLSLLGGVTHNGKPAEIVRHKDGKTISLATGEVVSSEDAASASMKRPVSDAFNKAADDDEYDALRSMARRKKGAKPEIQTCSLCEKEFKRPCDLTKHLKTHERPWKCPIEECKYHEHGWPTEKERERHVNDKHSCAPSLYHCLYKPCPYTSKRESNCKQHMEKAHGWSYVRSKNNGKGRASIPRLQRGSIPPSPASSMLTPSTPGVTVSPSVQSLSASESSRNASMPPPPMAGSSTWDTSEWMGPSTDFSDHFNFDFNNMMDAFPNSTTFPMTPALSDDRRASLDTGSSSDFHPLDGSVFDDGISPADLSYNNFDFNDLDLGHFTPDSTFAGPGKSHPALSSAAFPHSSPTAQLDQTFTTTTDVMHFDAAAAAAAPPTQDFTLFGVPAPDAGQGGAGDMFPSLAAGAGSWGSFGQHFHHPAHPALPAGNSAVDVEDLFPELKGRQ